MPRIYLDEEPFKNNLQMAAVIKEQRETLIDGSHILPILSMMRPIGLLDAISLEDLATARQKGLLSNKGHWLVRADDDRETDEYGWLCIHWPTLFHSIPWHHAAGPYLQSLGVNLTKLKLRSTLEREGAHKQRRAFAGSLLRALPPGSHLEADNPFFRKLVETSFQDRPEAYDADTLTAHLPQWAVIRFGALSLAHYKSIDGACAAYSGLSNLSIGGIDPDLLDLCPDVIRVLAAVLLEAACSAGKGWQKWGIAWTQAGLVFNYHLALSSLAAFAPAIYRRIFPNRGQNPTDICGEWRSGEFLMTAGKIANLPDLIKVARIDDSVLSHVYTTMKPYKMLFQDSDPEIAGNVAHHNSDMQMFFPVRMTDKKKGVVNIVEYFRQLVRLSQQKQAETYFEFTGQKTLHYVKKDVFVETRIPAKLAIAGSPEDPNKKQITTHKNTYFRVGFNAFNLGSMEIPEDPKIVELPYTIMIAPYEKRYFLSYPDQLVELLPILKDPRLYKFTDKASMQHTVQWEQSGHGWYARKLTGAEAASSHARANVFRKVMAYPNIKGTKILMQKENYYLSTGMVRPDSPLFKFLDLCVHTYPDKSDSTYTKLRNQVNLFKNFWNWIYAPEDGIAAGLYSQEFIYPLGFETEFCPKEHRLFDANRRLQFVIDKALHCNDEPIALKEGKGTRSDPRSKKPNTYDFFIFWYVAKHEIALLPEPLDANEQAEYITKRWMPWRKAHSAKSYLVNPYEKPPAKYTHPHIGEMFEYADLKFGKPFSKFG